MDSNRLTCLGIDNTGKLVLTYGQEDSDFYTDGDSSSGYVYRAAESTFFCRVRDLFTTELQAMFVDRESAGAWSADGLISQWDKMQSQFPEELWRKDIERKYLRTYQGISLDGSIAGTANPRFLTEMLNGRKKYQRRMFERNQELYMATKYFGNRATSDQIMMRFNNPVGVSIKPNFTLKITPYSDMYIAYSFSSTSKQNIRAKAGIEYTIPYSGDTADITLIYGASFIQAIGDLSRCYVGDNDFSKATRLQSLIIGSDTEGYSNGYMTKISLGSNELLEYLDVKNVTGLNSVIDLSNCNNMLELHAERSGATGAIFSNGGKLQKAYLPSITSLTVKNLNYIEEFEVESWDTLLSLIVENTSFFNTYDIINKAKNLTILRLIGMNWDESYQLKDSSILDRLLKLRGIGNDGYETSVAALTGTFFAAVMKQKALETYESTWKNLEIKYNTLVEQFAVTFVNDDGTILDVQYVDKGGNAVDPITRELDPISTPTKKSSVSTDYTFAGWDGAFTSIFAPKTITATYSESTRSYSITYKSRGTTLSGYPKTGLYGENIPYEGDTPTYTSEETAYKYYLFTGWDKSGIIDGDKVVNAVFDVCEYSDGYFNGKDLSDLRPVEVYAMTRLGLESTYVETKDSITISFGNDYIYSDVESIEIITEKTVFNGSNYVDTGIKLLNEDRDFVVAIDYKLKGETSSGGTLVQCFQSNGSNGFRLYFKSNSVSAVWGTTSQSIGAYNKREMLVLRHIKGESGLHVYFSNLDATNSLYYELDSTRSNITENSTLVFGCQRADDGEYENYAVGEIYWAKIWYADLGDSACKDLAIWTHETKKLEMSGFKNYYVSDSKRCSMTFVASELMDRNRIMNTTSSNVGGWAAMSLNKFMNDRMYKAIELQWRQLIKNVKIPSSVGGGSSTNLSTEISYSYCYLTIPALVEIISSKNSEPYSEEGKNIPFMTTSETRIRTQDGTAHSYWTRSPKADHAKYYCRIETDGSEYMYALPNSNEDGILLELSI